MVEKKLLEQVKNYEFLGQQNQKIRLSELFGNKKDLILIHNMGNSCPYCTMWADGFNGLLQHLQDRAAFVVSSPDDPMTQKDFASSRGWKFKMISTKKHRLQKIWDSKKMECLCQEYQYSIKTKNK